jgi:methionyl-tRNA formyltransferase
MRVVVAGKGWLAFRAACLLEALTPGWGIRSTIEVVRNGDDPGRDTWLPSLVQLASDRGWPVHRGAAEAALGRGDVLLSLQHDRIVDCRALGGAAAFNLHFARLPRYRGSLTSAWPIRNGDRYAGVTLHVLTEVVDGGPVIASREFPLPAFYTAYELYQAYHAHGFELLKEQLESLLRGTYVAVPQDDAGATIYTRQSIDFSDLELRDFAGSAPAVRDHCRSLIFPPRHHPTFRGRPVRGCIAVDAGSSAGLPPGSVVAEGPEYALVACGSGLVWLEYRMG